MSLRSMGHSTLSTVIALVGECGLRVLWITVVFAAVPEKWVLFINYPITWFVAFVLTMVAWMICKNRLLTLPRTA